ncbi:MAG: single-stranded-DNA-specific exonuclease RecJ [Xenococcaceae cyanobacterium MO_167.B27]|nr:single-stranded-DNA-specific exonuclease RecJ [Xenococcaceae cyanobacterium MO_167.B27]
MNQPEAQWQLIPNLEVPQWFIDAVRPHHPNTHSTYAAQLLWQRGIRSKEELLGFIDSDYYNPTPPSAFGEDMQWAIQRLQQARDGEERVTIWGDFDADGVTSTSVLWEGLGEFFTPGDKLDYYIPNRLTESHGLNCTGIDRLAESGTKLIVTCDTGSTNLKEINHATELGIDIIVTDHHTLPDTRPPVVAIINPRYLPKDHALYHLSGVAVAYKLVEGMYEALPSIPQQPIENLLDLVAIGLIADLVQLTGDCRYLAQRGIQQLRKQAKPDTAYRPGVSRLLEFCRSTGDRPTDISFGLGPRINAVSRIHGDASFCVELLTSRDREKCGRLAFETELANSRRKSLQKDTTESVKRKLELVDLSTTSVIVLEDPQWQGGVLGLVAGQIAQEYGRPTILLSSSETESGLVLARGSARSVNNIDLYQLVKSQEHLLHRFGGHPFAAGLSLALDNLPLFTAGINQQLKQQADSLNLSSTITADIEVKVSELGQNLFRELNIIEPCGMGNPVPKLLIKNCYFKNVWHNNIKDKKGNKIQYIKTTFNILDASVTQGFPGVWWGHYKDEIPLDIKCDVIAELDFNSYERQYEIRLMALRKSAENFDWHSLQPRNEIIVDLREEDAAINNIKSYDSSSIVLEKCPLTWNELQHKYREAIANNQKLILAYKSPESIEPKNIWRQLIGIAKYLSRTGKTVTKEQIKNKLQISDRSFNLGLKALSKIGFVYTIQEDYYQFSLQQAVIDSKSNQVISEFLKAIAEEQFQQQYFAKIPTNVISNFCQSVNTVSNIQLS